MQDKKLTFSSYPLYLSYMMTTDESIRINEIRWKRPAKTVESENWTEIQKYYDAPHTIKDTILFFKLHTVLWKSAVDLKKIIPRTLGESLKIRKTRGGYKHTLETKKLLSDKRKKFLSENPDKHPWKKSSKFVSEPCEHLKKILKERGINFVEEYQPLLNQGRFFSIDIAMPDKNLGIEVNGNQHYNRDGMLKNYYKERYDLISKSDWNLHEVHYSLVYNQNFVERLINSISSSNTFTPFDYTSYISEKIKKQDEKLNKKKRLKTDIQNSIFDWNSFSELTMKEIQEITSYKLSSIYCYMNRNGFKYKKSPRPKLLKTRNKNQGRNAIKITSNDLDDYIPTQRKFNPSKEELYDMIWKFPYTKVAEHYGVSDVAIRKRAKFYSLDLPPFGYWVRRNKGYSHDESMTHIPTPASRSKVLSNEVVKGIKQRLNSGSGIRELSNELNLGYETIKSIKYGRTYKSVI